MSFALEINNLKKTYSNGNQALKGVNLKIQSGDFFALLGRNGAGKSTMINIISTLVNKTSGTVKVMGFDLDKERVKAKMSLGIVPQEINFSAHETPYQILTNQAAFFGIPPKIAKQRAETYLKQVELWGKHNSISNSLSGGMKRRLMIARALMHNPKLLILDEPTAGVDIEIRHSMWEFFNKLNQEGITIILTTHYLEEAENLCKNIAVINHGEIIWHMPMVKLLNQLESEIFILNLEQPLKQLPKTKYHLTQIDEQTLEISVCRTQCISRIISDLADNGLFIQRMRNKTNRLEQLFVGIINASKN